MNQKRHEYDIDALLQNSWLQVISLRHDPVFKEGEGRALWEHCVSEVERVQHVLKEAGYDPQSCEHIIYAQCALIDEVVKGRGVQDDACLQWYHLPLQGHFLGTVDAGDRLCNRMREVPPSPVVLTCFQRVMALGFLGGYLSPDDPERKKLVQALDAQANQQLSLKRAEALRDGMLSTSDVSPACFAVQGFGDTRPVATNNTPKGRAFNRRVEISLVPQADACQAADTPPASGADVGITLSKE